MLLPYTLTFNVSVVNVTATASNVSLSVAVAYLVDFNVTIPNSAVTIANNSVPFNASGQYSTVINQNFLTGWCSPNCYANGELLEGPYSVSVWLTVVNSSNPAVPATTTSAAFSTQLAAHPSSGHFLNPTPGTTVPYGTLTISGEYNGSFVRSANVSIYNAGSSTPVFVQGVLSPQATPNQQEAFSFDWTATTGSYVITLWLGAPYGTRSVSENVTVASPVPAAHYNTTGFSLDGMSPGATGALLIVVGIAIGEVTGLLVARFRSASRSAAAAAPAAVPAAVAAGPSNECPVCHEVLASPEEMKEHAKTLHGLTL
jgi:hypothetical protein